MSPTIMIDGLIIALLAATLVFGFRLNRRLVTLRANQSELSSLVTTLNEAASRAEAGIAGLKVSAEQAGTNLQTSIDRARRLNDELVHRTERSAAPRPTERARADAAPSEDARGESRKRLEREILNALRAAR